MKPIRCLFLPLLTTIAAAQIPAFPGAEGYGGYAKGGRGGDVYIVTNLSGSSVPGSFRYGIETVPTAGRTIVFAVSGHIHINGLRLTGSKVTIAGQTAPGDGVGLIDGTFRISGDDVVVRHLRFRHRKSGSGGDCVNLDSGSINSMLDSVSMQFSTDENFSSFNSPPENLTMQWSLNGWGLESHSCGGLWDQNHATAHHTLWSHNHTRNPKARPGGLLEWTNNVTFDWDIGFIMGDSESPASWKANVIGNYFLSPPGNTRSKALQKATVDRNGNPNFSVHLGNNRHDDDGDALIDGTDKGYSIVEGSEFVAGDPAGANRYAKSLTPFANTGAIPVTTDDPVVAFKKVASKAGALRLDLDPAKPLRDEVDTRMIQNLVTQTRNHITRESDLVGVSNGGIGTLNSTAAPVDTDKDGMPDFYEIALGWNPAVQDHNTALPNSGGFLTGTTFMPTVTVAGYTRLEEYLHYLAIPHGTVAKSIVGTPTNVATDLRKFTSGFSVSPTFTVANVVGGGVVLSGAGNAIATFTPTLNFVGRAKFDFTVTDSAGHTWTQTCAIVVTNAGLPRDLKWQGGLSSNIWDGATNNWLRNGAATNFSFGDRVTFDDTGSQSPAVNVPGTVAPGTVDFDAAGNYTLSGSGAITSSGALTKRGNGTLTIGNSGVNSFSTATLDAGTLTLNVYDALGVAPLALNAGTLNLGASTPSPLAINSPVTINAGSGNRESLGEWTGAGTAALNIGNTTFSLRGNTSAFAGTITLGSSTGFFRLYGSLGSPAATFDLGTSTADLLNRNGNATIELGALLGGSGTALSGASSTASPTTYRIGANGNSTTFAGAIANGSGLTHITKTGPGTLTLSGTSTYTGATVVENGALLIDGTLGNTAVTVAAGKLLGGDGVIGGSVTANAGAFLSPGTAPFTGATMTVGGGLTLNAATMYCDMSGTPGGANDKIVVNGNLTYAGTPFFQFYLVNGSLGAGNYDLVTAAGSVVPGGTPGALPHNLPAGTRQTFTVKRSSAGANPSLIWLEVLGDPATLTWTGATSANWDTTTANNWTGAAPNTFGANDAVILDDSTAVRNVTVTGSVAPRSITVNTAAGYTLGGGTIDGASSLVKNGPGTLTFAGTSANTFTGGLTLNAGTINFATDDANNGALGAGPVTLNAGTLSIFSSFSSFDSFTAALVVPTGATATINADSRVDIYGTLSGSGTLNFSIPSNRTSLFADWSAFTGVLNATTTSGYAELRTSQGYNPAGFTNATVNLGNNITAVHTGNVNQGAGTIIAFGALSGPASSRLLGGPDFAGGRLVTYRIGGKGGDTTFAGTIAEQNAGVTNTSITKTGAGIWTLSGTSNYNGGTTVEQGILKITGSVTCVSATNVFTAAKLELSGGSLTTEALNIADDATLAGHGTLTSDLNAAGNLDGRGFATGTPGTLTLQGSAYLADTSLARLRGGVSSDLIAVSGDLALGGTVQVSLAPGTSFGRYPLFTCGGTLTGSAALTGIPGGTTAQLSTSVAGRLDLVIDDSDEDGLPDSWETLYLGNLSQGPADDTDGDGQSNAVELLAGTHPKNGSSRFAATITPAAGNQFTLTWPSVPGKTYAIETHVTLVGAWSPLTTVPAAASPATTTSYSLTPAGNAKFYRVVLGP